MNADPMEMTRFYWATDDSIIFSARQQVRDKIDGFNRGVYETTRGLLTLDKDPKKSKWTKIASLSSSGGGLLGPIEAKPNKFLTYQYDKGSYYPKYFEYDVETGRRKLITRETPKTYRFRFDGEGNPQFAEGYDAQSDEFLSYYRKKGNNDWEVINRSHRENFEDWRAVGVDPLMPTNLLVVAHNGNDIRALWSFDPTTKKYEELIFRAGC